MRNLYLMLGTPASGKSELIKKMKLEDYTISADVVRSIVSTPKTLLEPSDDERGERLKQDGIDYRDEGYTWRMIYSLLERRMSQGETTIVDATHLFKGAFREYDKLRIKYNYKVFLIDVMDTPELVTNNQDELIEKLVERDLKRGGKVDRDTIKKYVDRYLSKSGDWLPNWITRMNPREFKESLKFDNYIEDFNRFNKIQVIGDVHGDLGALKKVFKDHKKGTAYVFVGDYLDRGNKNQEVLDFVNELKGNNIFLLRGNHEWSMERFINKDERTGNFGSRTLPILRENYSDDEALKKDLRKLQKRLRNYLLFEFHGRRYLITHAGVDPLIVKAATEENPSYLLPFGNEEDFVMGVSQKNGDPYKEDVDISIGYETLFGSSYKDLAITQIHGHRNEFNHFAIENSAINLTKDGKFRWVTICSCEMYRSEIDSIDGETFVSRLFSDKNIRNVELEDGIVAHNFTREAFRKGIWDNMTTHARGLFTKGDKIIGRGFKKFFYEGQNEESKLINLNYPVRAYRKYNGFLAIAFIDPDTGKVYIKSKGGGEMHSKLAKNKIIESEMYDGLCEFLNDYTDVSVLFEIIDPKHDPHIVHYTDSQAIPLVMVRNNERGECSLDLLDEFISKYLKSNRLITPEFIASNEEDLLEKKDRWMRENPTEEGLVLYDSRFLMIKEKTDFYNKAKELRRAMENHGYVNYKYGSANWYKRVKKKGIKKFTPDLAVKLWENDNYMNDLAQHANKKKTLTLKDDIEVVKFDGSKKMAEKYSLEPWGADSDCSVFLDDKFVPKGGYIITKNGKAIYLTELPLFDIFEQVK